LSDALRSGVDVGEDEEDGGGVFDKACLSGLSMRPDWRPLFLRRPPPLEDEEDAAAVLHGSGCCRLLLVLLLLVLLCGDESASSRITDFRPKWVGMVAAGVEGRGRIWYCCS
jgi:hypothetical protein